MTHYGKRKACDQSHLSHLPLTSINLGLLYYYRWSTPSSSFLSLGLKFTLGSPEKYLWKSTGLKCSEHTAEWFCRLPMRSFRLDKISPFFTSFTGLGAIIAEERNYMESYTFFKVRNVVATKGNTSSRHFTTPHTSYFTENINKERNESPCLTSLPTFGPGSSGSVTRENIAIFQLFQGT